jgi:hypothetical protein
MRLALFVVAALVAVLSATAAAQEYVEYASQQDGFTIIFPVQPTVTQTTFKTQTGTVLPARVYTADSNAGYYQVTVVDYTNIHQLAIEKAKDCPPGAETCSGTESDASSTGRGYWKADISGATIYATYLYLQRDAKLAFMGWATMDLVEGTLLNLINNKDKSHTSIGIYMHESRLYMFEGTRPAGEPPADWFQQNVGWLDPDGNPIRYLTVYHQGYPKPEVARRRAPQP